MVLGSNKTVQATIALMAACGVSLINDAQRIRRALETETTVRVR